MSGVDERMDRLRRQMLEARMRLSRERMDRMDRRLREYQRSAAARAEEEECGPGEPVALGELSNRLMESLSQIARGDVEQMSVDQFRKELRRRTLDS